MSSIKLISLCNKKLLQKSLPFGTASLNRYSSDWVPKEVETHTGQKWEEDDYRLVRFIDKPKQVNKQFGVHLIAEIPPKRCKDRVVWCDGGSGPTGHPKVFINLDKPGEHSCGYCGLRFVLDHSH